jgi:hypothetical protein
MHLSVQKLWAANMTQCIINVFITRCVIDVNHQKMPDTKRFRVPHLAFVFVPRGLTVYLSVAILSKPGCGAVGNRPQQEYLRTGT